MDQILSPIHISPLISMPFFYGGMAALFVLVLLSLWRFRIGGVIRFIVGALLLLILLSPSWLQEQREAVSDVALVVLDKSPSQSFGDRLTQSERALQHIRDVLDERTDIELRVLEVEDKENLGETRLFSILDETLIDVPFSRRAGVILITDGQIHDVPFSLSIDRYGPVHALLSGKKDEYDRRIVIVNAPAYGITGQNVDVTIRIEDTRLKNNRTSKSVPLILRNQEGEEERFDAVIGQDYTFPMPVEHAGQNVMTFKIPTDDEEISAANNHNAILVNGVRDRLKVLLVSGLPHIGERTWRNLLTSDPGVDLVHFTILREINKRDNTPQEELSLIPFPFQELFEVKLYDFDLIIFDNYRLNQILPLRYFENIVRYVKEGGAFLEASGASYMDINSSTYSSPLHAILPLTPQQGLVKRPYMPTLSSEGEKHPVTRNLKWGSTGDNGQPLWGVWLQQNRVNAQSGQVLLSGAETLPLLTLDNVDKGRVAQISSDNIWLWAKGYNGGGPHADLLRRVIHWLMKEPSLDEDAMIVDVSGQDITVKLQDYNVVDMSLQIAHPHDRYEKGDLTRGKDGWLTYTMQGRQPGIYQFTHAQAGTKFAIIGSANPKEFQDIRATTDLLKTISSNSKGRILWLEDITTPRIASIQDTAMARYGGRGWLGLRKNNDYNITSAKAIPLFTVWVSVFLLICSLTFIWWFEGRHKP